MAASAECSGGTGSAAERIAARDIFGLTIGCSGCGALHTSAGGQACAAAPHH